MRPALLRQLNASFGVIGGPAGQEGMLVSVRYKRLGLRSCVPLWAWFVLHALHCAPGGVVRNPSRGTLQPIICDAMGPPRRQSAMATRRSPSIRPCLRQANISFRSRNTCFAAPLTERANFASGSASTVSTPCRFQKCAWHTSGIAI